MTVILGIVPKSTCLRTYRFESIRLLIFEAKKYRLRNEISTEKRALLTKMFNELLNFIKIIFAVESIIVDSDWNNAASIVFTYISKLQIWTKTYFDIQTELRSYDAVNNIYEIYNNFFN